MVYSSESRSAQDRCQDGVGGGFVLLVDIKLLGRGC